MFRRLLLNNPITNSMMFFPRRMNVAAVHANGFHSGTLATDGIRLGYRLHPVENARGLVIFFHGNGEIASDNDDLAGFYSTLGLSCLLADYRGYGWSDGHPNASDLLPDAETIFQALPLICAEHDIHVSPIIIHGRSLGGAPAIHIAHRYQSQVAGLILESTFAHEPSIMQSIGVPLFLLRYIPSLFDNLKKMREINLPLVVIHGESDSLIPIWHGEALFDSSPSTQKQMIRVPLGEHNNTVMMDPEGYMAALRWLVETAISKP